MAENKISKNARSRRIGTMLTILEIILLFILLPTQITSADNSQTQSHATHVLSIIGPQLVCKDCHNVRNALLFSDNKPLATTTVCDTCHSPGGTFDGVNDQVIGAKSNWKYGIYDNGSLKTGKEKWCVGCHDNVPSLIKGAKAPNVTGDGVNYGYYVSGHGEHGNMSCGYCHNLSSKHINVTAYSANKSYLTYDPTSDAYKNGYRLKDVPTGYGGKYPMYIPRTGHVYPPGFRQDWEFALCFECHNSTKLFNGGDPITGEGAETNFRMLIDGGGGGNPAPVIGKYYSLHDVHTWGANGPWGPETPQYDSDFNGAADSRISCPSCHNVHGSNSPAMVRTGELEGKVPALNLKYVDNTPGSALHFISRNLLVQSTGAGMDVSFGQGTVASNGVCNMCHAQQTGGPGPHTAYYRSPVISNNSKCTVCHP